MLYQLCIYFPGIVSLLWGTVLLLTRNRRNDQNWLMVFSFTTALFFFSIAACSQTENTTLLIASNVAATFLSLLMPVFIYLYTKKLAGYKKIHWVYLLTLLPPVVIGLVNLVTLLLMGETDAAEFLKACYASNVFPEGYDGRIYKAFSANIVAGSVVFVLELISVLFYLTGVLKHNDFRWTGVFRFLKGESASPITALCVQFIAIIILCIIRFGAGRFYFQHVPLVSGGISLVLGILFFYVGYVGIWLVGHRFSYVDMSLFAYATGETPDILSSPFEKTALLEKNFSEWFENEKPYLNPDLSMDDVVKAVGTNRTYLSILVNKCFGMNFRDFVNTHRIEHAKEILESDPECSVDDVAEQSGFLNGAQFCRKFKELTGKTPKAWSREQ